MKRCQSYIIMLLTITLMISSCSVTPTVDNTILPAPTVTTVSNNTAPPAISATPGLPTLSPSAAATDTTPPTPMPLFTPRPVPQYIVNSYTATDGKTIYYYNNNGVHSMDTSGQNDHKVKLSKGFYSFVYLDSSNLYYLIREGDYSPQCENDHGQTFLSFSLMEYRLKTGKNRRLQQHLYCATETNGEIYMLDHEDHTRVRSYQTKTGKLKVLSGGPKEKDFMGAYILESQDGAYLYTGYGDYPIHGGVISNDPVEMPIETECSSFYTFDDGDIKVWDGSGYKSCGIKSVYHSFDVGDKVYVLSIKDSKTDEEYNTTETVLLYEVNQDGKVKELMKKSCSYSSEETLCFEFISGWLFCFTVYGFESGDISSYVFKHKVA